MKVDNSDPPSDSLNNEVKIKEGVPRRTQFDEQERYHLLLKEYVESLSLAENDEERDRLRREFDEETREYNNSMTEEKEDLKKRYIEKERQALEGEYHKQLRQLEQARVKEVRQLEQDCRRDEFGVDNKNRLALEPAMCKKMPVLEEEFKRRFKFLEDNYNAKLRELKKE